MSLFITSLNSGSNGNCYFIGNDKEAVLIDAGISCRETEKRMARLQLSMQKVKAIFISHEHSDHIRGVEVLSRKYKLPVYITSTTLMNSPIRLEKDLTRTFKANNPIHVGELTVTAFSKHHDASDPHSFIIEGNEVKIGVLTDIGATCEQVIHYFKQCHAAFLEANYDDELLENGRYPFYLKKRIRGGKGHLSNVRALKLFIEHKPTFMSHLFLSHLSKDNNSPELAENLFLKHAERTTIVIASRYKEIEVYNIRKNTSENKINAKEAFSMQATQMTLF